MKIRVRLWLTITLFVMMVGAGVASGCLGYYMGREALKAVTQPDINSDEPVAKRKPLGGEHKGLKIVNEREILVKVYNLIHAKENNQSKYERSPKDDNETNLVQYQEKKN
ncbi:MAG: hypothetical protein Tsb0014_10240 [Pleurocapsa sp.]